MRRAALISLAVVGVSLPFSDAFGIYAAPARWAHPTARRASCAPLRQLAASGGGGEPREDWRRLPHVDRGQAIRIGAAALGIGGGGTQGAAAAAAPRDAPPAPRSASSIDGWTALPVWPVWPTPASPVLTLSERACVHVSVSLCICMCICVCMCLYVHVRMYVHVHVNVSTRMCLCVSVCVCVCVSLSLSLSLSVYTYITHTLTPFLSRPCSLPRTRRQAGV